MNWTVEELRSLADDLCLLLSPEEEADLLQHVEKMAQAYQAWCPSDTGLTHSQDGDPTSDTSRETVWRADEIDSNGLSEEFWARVPAVERRLVVVPRVVNPHG